MTFVRIFCRRFCSWLPPRDAGPSEIRLYREPNLSIMLDILKKYSNYGWFHKHPDVYDMAVSRLSSAKQFSWVEELLEYQKKFCKSSDESFSVRLITLYGRSGMFKHAYQVFDEIRVRSCPQTLASFNAILLACVNSKRLDKIEELFLELPSKLSLVPDVASYNIFIMGLCKKKSYKSAILVLDKMSQNNVAPDFTIFKTLCCCLTDACRFGDIDKIWVRMKEANVIPDLLMYNSRMKGLTKRNVAAGEKLLEEMAGNGIEADYETFNLLLEPCSKHGDLEAAQKYYAEMVRRGVTPHKTTFWILIWGAINNGNVDLVLMWCKDIFKYKCPVKEELLNSVINLLVERSMLKEADMLLNKIHSCKFIPYKRVTPKGSKG